MDPWRKETLNLQVGDFIIWQGEAIEIEGQPAVVEPGMKAKVISLYDGFHLDVALGKPIPPKAIVQFESGMRLMVDERMKWERVNSPRACVHQWRRKLEKDPDTREDNVHKEAPGSARSYLTTAQKLCPSGPVRQC